MFIRLFALSWFAFAFLLQTLSPHNAVLNETIRPDSEKELIENLEAYLRTGSPNTPVNA